jgi:PhzF family phenazine biosynthesis protein
MDYVIVNVFAAGVGGGNPAPVVMDAGNMSDAQMQAVAISTGHESAFVLPPTEGSACDFEFRFWVPGHEMSMCGHATIGAVWLLHRYGLITKPDVTIATASGPVVARIDGSDSEHVRVEITQPEGVVLIVDDPDSRAAISRVLGLGLGDLANAPVLNSKTSRVKTLIPIRTVDALRSLSPRLDEVEELCNQLGSTGLYPYAAENSATRDFEARQFPQSSGYPEDPATGIAAAALAFGLLHTGVVARSSAPIHVMQGVSMGRPSRIEVRFNSAASGGGCWVSGGAELDASPGSGS